MLIKITFDRFVEMLEERRSVFCPNGIDDCVWNYYIGLLRDNDGCNRPTNNDPQIIVDNIYVNGNWGDYSNYTSALETDEEFELRAISEGAVVFPDERIVIYKSPVMEDIIYG